MSFTHKHKGQEVHPFVGHGKWVIKLMEKKLRKDIHYNIKSEHAIDKTVCN